jgi:hypothetical protein
VWVEKARALAVGIYLEIRVSKNVIGRWWKESEKKATQE